MRSLFADREFIMRARGEVRFLRVSARLQMRVAAALALVLLAWLATAVVMAVSSLSISQARAESAERLARAARIEAKIATERRSIESVAADLERRQSAIETVVETHFAPIDEPAAAADEAAAKDARPGTPLARIDERQRATVRQLTRIAETRAERAQAAFRRLGLNPDVIARPARAQGGPFLPFFGAADAEPASDPDLVALRRAAERMVALEQGVTAIPTRAPALGAAMTSGFGYRRDPFTGAGAMHSGLDFAGAHGSAVMAAAPGTVTFAGVRSGYGNCVEVSHGGGLMTRYAHLASIAVRPGMKVAGGARLGGMGSTGRSTGTHLHFEVRIGDRAVNPRPFLEARDDVLQIKIPGRTAAARGGARADG